MKVACYCRVSREDLNNENQAKIIRDYCLRQGWEDLHWFKEEMSSRKTRPIKAEVIKKCRNGDFDTLIFVRIDRFARSTTELVMDIEELVNRGIRVISIQNGFDFSKKDYNSTNMLMLRIFSAFAEFEREIIRERTMEGLSRVRAQGKIGGRHPLNCGCGKTFENGNRHNGYMKPVRDEHQKHIGWKDERTINKESV